ncbi:hypothetical protein GUJ93_ZPchr0003g17432 [Zizania palustris]|uniref:Uncharacterized protein n=1 Tax=Zizania palustris TaxID=103762 RepID=A0A8J5S150_ZIZPA|nr:hypothetical protein GUJ93_ZPchr0003g17432 [Zizania palustris]
MGAWRASAERLAGAAPVTDDQRSAALGRMGAWCASAERLARAAPVTGDQRSAALGETATSKLKLAVWLEEDEERASG